MFESIGGFKIEGGIFKQPTILMPFHRPADPKRKDGLEAEKKTVIIYGKNGSGKSSIAQAIKEYIEGHDRFTQVNILDNNKNIIDKSLINLNSIYIFNEDFINDEIRFTADEKLNAIILQGKNKVLDDEIKKLEKERLNLTDEIIPSLQKQKTNYENSKNVTSPLKYFNHAKVKLQNKWAKREELIKGIKKAASVSDDLVKDYLKKEIKEHDAQLLEAQYTDLFEKLKKAKTGSTIDISLAPIVIDDQFDVKIKVLLAEVVEKPQLSLREQEIMKLLEMHQYAHLKNDRDNFLADDNLTCPLCVQSVELSYKDSLSNSIKKIFNTESAKKHIDQLNKLIDQLYEFSIEKTIYQCYELLNKELVDNLQIGLEIYNEQLNAIKKILIQKRENIYVPILDFSLSLEKSKNDVNAIIFKLEQVKSQFNDNVKNRDNLVQKLRKINSNLAILEISEYKEDYIKQSTNYEELKVELDNQHKKLKTLNIEIGQLNAEKANIKLAIDLINNYLSYIFFSPDRIKIIPDEDKYSVLVRGEPVLLKSLSEGEKNAIALCYFFSTILENKAEKDYFKDECLIILDDPISSFDMHNKVGIFSFLRHMISHIHKENVHSRILILTHQVEAVFHLDKICADTGTNTKLWILENNSLENFSGKNHNEYSYLLNQVFDYANKTQGYEQLDYSIGNTMRKILECFGTFSYKLGIERISTTENVLELITDKNKRKYFNHLMYRLVLHNESHLEYTAKVVPETDFFSFIGQDEKIRTAKELLIFLMLINKLHVESHLFKKQDIKIIERWENEIFPTTTTDAGL